MDSIQEQHERAVSDRFIQEYNHLRGKNYVFERRPRQAPDHVYRDGGSEIQVEVVTCYYDSDDAKITWQNVRNIPNAPTTWLGGVNADQALVMNINAAIKKKCKKDYDSKCILVVYIMTPGTTVEEMETLLPSIEVPPNHKFLAIYLTGNFGVSTESAGGYRVWKLSP
jgi:hypothetical protein